MSSYYDTTINYLHDSVLTQSLCKYIGSVVDLHKIKEPKDGDVTYVTSTNNTYIYINNEWILLSETIDDGNYNTTKMHTRFLTSNCKCCGAVVDITRKNCEYCGAPYEIEYVEEVV